MTMTSGEILPTPPPSVLKSTMASQKRMLDDDKDVITEEQVGNFEPYMVNTDQKERSTYYLPYIPGFKESGNLDNHTISLNGTHFGNDKNSSEYFVHNANGHMGLKRLQHILQTNVGYSQNAKRALIYSESTFPGSGSFGAALVTDLYRSWSNLRTMIAQVMTLSVSGVSNVVTDICGSMGPLDEELCHRWAQVSAFLPMARFYYKSTYLNPDTGKEETTDPSELFNFKDVGRQLGTASALTQRLIYSRYIYSQMY